MAAKNSTQVINEITKETVLRSKHVFVIDSDDGQSVFTTKGIELGLIKQSSIKSITTTPYSQIEDDDTIFADATLANILINLLPVANRIGKKIKIIKTDVSANTVTIDGNAAELINAATTKVLTAQFETVTLESNGVQWFIV